jgi:predicted ATPase/DNA-binding XRE family transcriptional regulator
MDWGHVGAFLKEHRRRIPRDTPSLGSYLRVPSRRGKAVTQEELAEAIGVSRVWYAMLESGKAVSTSQRLLARLVEALHLSAENRKALFNLALPKLADSLYAFDGATLPHYLTSFVGRDAEVDELVPLVRDHRLVTLVGAGGSGKTRLACVTATALAGGFSASVFVDLAGATDPDLLALQVASTLRIEAQRENAARRIADVLGQRHTLLLLDNAEHVVEPLAMLVAEIVQRSPMLHVLVTSRERLGINGERVYRLQPLSMSAALQLFVDRALDGDPHFRLDKQLVPVATDIVRRLDRLPLAIELTVARLASFGLHELQRRLDRQLALPGAKRDSPARQQTIRATIAWSYELLEQRERLVCARLAVFVGGFTLEAASIVASCDSVSTDEVISILANLVDKSIVQIDTDESSRYRLFESVRLFGLERLIESGTFTELVRRHGSWLAEIADASDAEILSGTSRTIVRGMRADIDNIRAALDRLLATGETDDRLLAARIVGGLRTLWINLGAGHAEGQRWARQLLATLDDERDSELYIRLVRLEMQTADRAEDGIGALQRSIDHCAKTGDRLGVVNGHAFMIALLLQMSDSATAARVVEASAEFLTDDWSVAPNIYAYLAGRRSLFFATQGDFASAHSQMSLAERIAGKPAEFVWGLSMVKADVEAQQGNYERAVALAEVGLANCPVGYDLARLLAESTAACYRILAGDIATASSKVLPILERVSVDFKEPMAVDWAVGMAASIAVSRGRIELAGRLDGSVEPDAWRYFFAGSRLVQAQLDAALTSALGSKERSALFAEGRRLTSADSVRLAFQALS